jgi:acetoin utilization protein AcuB
MSLESTVGDLMTKVPLTVGRGVTIEYASGKMREHDIRHLPVMEGGKLIGVVSERDVALAGALNDVDPTKVAVEEAMSNPWTVLESAQLVDVVREMTVHKYGSALVVDVEGHLVGIFTTHDALQALSEILEGDRLSSAPQF